MNFTVRPPTIDEWRAIAALLEEAGLPLDGAQEHVSDFLLAVADAAVVGCAAMEGHGAAGLLRSVAVAPLLQRRGVGKMLVSRLLLQAGERGIKRVYLLTVTAAEYFERMGFRRQSIEQAPGELQQSAEFRGACPASAIFMELVLPDPN